MINFLYPSFLWALLSLSIPVIIHLFNFKRYKKVHFSNVAFLREVQKASRSRSQIKRWLLLLMRMLALAALVLAFAQPVIVDKKAAFAPDRQKIISIYIDNSFSMDAESKNGRLIDLAKKYADDIVAAAGASARIQILTNAFLASEQLLYTSNQAQKRITNIRVQKDSRQASDVINRMNDILKKYPNTQKSIYYISDFQKALFNIDKVDLDSTIQYRLVPVQPQKIVNISLDSAWNSSPELIPGKPATINFKVQNFGEQNIKAFPVQFTINNSPKTPANINVSANGSANSKVTFLPAKPGFFKGELQINDNQILYDDKLYFCLAIQEKIQVLNIQGQADKNYIEKVFANDSIFMYSAMPIGQINYNIIQNSDLLILNQIQSFSSGLISEISNWVKKGGTALLIPPAGADIKSYNKMLGVLGANTYLEAKSAGFSLQTPEKDNPFFKGIFGSISPVINMPDIIKYYPISTSSTVNAFPILKLQNGMHFYSKTLVENGQLFSLAVGLDNAFGNFPRHALFVPILIKTAFLSRRPEQLYYTFGKDKYVSVSYSNTASDKNLKFEQKATQFENIPAQKLVNGKTLLYFNAQMRTAGFYDVISPSGKTIYTFAINYNRDESNPNVLKPEEIEKQVGKKIDYKNLKIMVPEPKTFKATVTDLQIGKHLWKTFIIFALIFLALETAIIRLFPG